ncbi:hypothetical protein AGOR_G00230280 [Albula goreensis]|uniref:E3 ubiquitin-protein ligase RNF25 n=1 Tax=Albula goreensis TaxID=1534307 RepID=A0A8T3CQ07_9TELE|nr:hypothetical protein AGOR_G00230280 [Albula goreensis]
MSVLISEVVTISGVVPGVGRMKMAAESEVLSEIEVLQSIYLEELRVNQKSGREWAVSIDLHPSTAEDSLSQFVRLTLTLTLDSQYPLSPPLISIHNPRGLSDDKLLSVQQCLVEEAQAYLGAPVLYQLIEKAKEILTESNIPHGNCVICLYGFKEGEVFTKTSCYHYFHSHCLGRYVSHAEDELKEREKELQEDKTRGKMEGEELSVVCPVCREPLTYDLQDLVNSPAPRFSKVEGTVLGSEFKRKWAELQNILERQREKGGIIDPEVESKRFLIHINEAPPDASSIHPDPEIPPIESPLGPSTNQATVSQGSQLSGHSQCRRGSCSKRHGQPKWSRRREISRDFQAKPTSLTDEDMAKLSLSAGTRVAFTGGAAGADDRQREARKNYEQPDHKAHSSQSELMGEQCVNIPQAKVHGDMEITNPASSDTFKTHNFSDSAQPVRGRGQPGRRRSAGHRPRPSEERNLPGFTQTEAPRDRACHGGGRGFGHRGRRGGGENNTYFRGGGTGRKSGRGYTQSG